MSNDSTVHNFFATAADMSKVLLTVGADHALQYARCGLFDSPECPVFDELLSLPNFGVAQVGDSNFEPTFLVLPKGTRVNVRTIPQRRGGTKYAVDQLINPGTVVVRPGGKYRDVAVIAGMVSTVHHDGTAERLMKAFSTSLKREFARVKSYTVGPEARSLYDLGLRLTRSVQTPQEFDLSA
jgi:hypothetical protein